jgi:hypothetical protein
MIASRPSQSPLAVGVLAVGVVTMTYAFVAGCGSGQEAPPNTATQAQAESTPPDQSGGPRHHHLPPPAAFEACKDKSVGTACTVQIHDADINGTCEAPPPGSSQNTPACRPAAGARHHHGPPPEAVFAACDNKADGDACSVTLENRTIDGSCRTPHHDAGTARLLCAPAHPHKNEGGK